MNPRMLIAGAAPALVLALAAACNGGDDGQYDRQLPTATPAPAPAGAPSPPTIVDIDILNFSFGLEPVTVDVGTTIRWTNQDGARHTTTWTGGDTATTWDSGVLPQGQSHEVTFLNAGTFAYACTIHPSMTHTIIAQ